MEVAFLHKTTKQGIYRVPVAAQSQMSIISSHTYAVQ